MIVLVLSFKEVSLKYFNIQTVRSTSIKFTNNHSFYKKRKHPSIILTLTPYLSFRPSIIFQPQLTISILLPLFFNTNFQQLKQPRLCPHFMNKLPMIPQNRRQFLAPLSCPLILCYYFFVNKIAPISEPTIIFLQESPTSFSFVPVIGVLILS